MINLNPDNGFGGLSTQHGKKNLAAFLACIEIIKKFLQMNYNIYLLI